MKKFFVIGVAVIIVAVAGFILWPDSFGQEQIYCTQDAKLCPDGSYVGRTGPKCEFAACPDVQR